MGDSNPLRWRAGAAIEADEARRKADESARTHGTRVEQTQYWIKRAEQLERGEVARSELADSLRDALAGEPAQVLIAKSPYNLDGHGPVSAEHALESLEHHLERHDAPEVIAWTPTRVVWLSAGEVSMAWLSLPRHPAAGVVVDDREACGGLTGWWFRREGEDGEHVTIGGR